MHQHGKIISSAFKPGFLIRNRHLQTMMPSIPISYRKPVEFHREILTLPDGDETAIDWAGPKPARGASGPVLVILHGLESSGESAYARMMLHAALAQGWDACVMHFRDCGDYRNRLPRRYHAGETGDVRYFLEQLQATHSGPIVVVGYSLGGNVLLKYLGETGEDSGLAAAAAVCVPLDLQACSTRLSTGFSKLYQHYLIRNMKLVLLRKFPDGTPGVDMQRALSAKTFDEFDDAVTAPLHGFDGKDDYYRRCSSGQFLGAIRTPTLVLNAIDDPFMSETMLPREEQLASSVTLELSDYGGHVGFLEGGWPIRPRYYIPKRLIEYLGPYTAGQSTT